MSETVLTSPIILDATGQDMLTKLDSIISAINPVAQGVSYDNAGTGMVANNVQSAITELKTGLVNTNSSLTHYDTVSGTASSTQYGGYYYVDLTPSVAINRVVSTQVISSTSNTWASCTLTASAIRVWTNRSESNITVKYGYV